jgi:hypothetical protein
LEIILRSKRVVKSVLGQFPIRVHCRNPPRGWPLGRPSVTTTTAARRDPSPATCSRFVLTVSGARRPSLPTASPCPVVQDRGLPETSLAGAIVQPASGPASWLMQVRRVMFMAFTRINPLFVIYHSHTPDGRGRCRHRPRPEQPPLNPTFLGGNESCGGAAH